MSHAKAIGRFGMLAVGLGIGAAVAVTPGIAFADSSAIDAAAFDPSALIADAAPASDLNLSISIDGFSLLQEGTAHADSGANDIAIAFGSDSTADAGYTNEPGAFDYAFADGTNAIASAGGLFTPGTVNTLLTAGNDNFASAVGTDVMPTPGRTRL